MQGSLIHDALYQLMRELVLPKSTRKRADEILRDEQFYFRLRAGNGEVILASEGYTSEAGCQNGIESVKENAISDERFLRKVSTDNQFYFILAASNGEPIGSSEMYTSETARERGINAVKSAVPAAPIETEV